MNTKQTYYEQPGVTVDAIIFTVNEGKLKVLLVKRGNEPYAGVWSIPGGFITKGESLEEAALRVMKDKTGVDKVYLEQLYTFGSPERDPRSRVITVSYFALIPWKHLKHPKSEKITDLAWFSIEELPKELAFDHGEILKYAVNRLIAKVGYSNVVYGLLPEAFRLSDLQKMYEIIMNRSLDKRNFRKRMLATDLLEPTGKKDIEGAHRPAMLYKFKKREVVFFD